jgi:hypothetical protein
MDYRRPPTVAGRPTVDEGHAGRDNPDAIEHGRDSDPAHLDPDATGVVDPRRFLARPSRDPVRAPNVPFIVLRRPDVRTFDPTSPYMSRDLALRDKPAGTRGPNA